MTPFDRIGRPASGDQSTPTDQSTPQDSATLSLNSLDFNPPGDFSKQGTVSAQGTLAAQGLDSSSSNGSQLDRDIDSQFGQNTDWSRSELFQREAREQLSFSPSNNELASNALVKKNLIPAMDITDSESGKDSLVLAGAFGKRESSPGATRLGQVAESLEGQQLWRKSPYAGDTQNGVFGCAASASIALQRAGYKYADSPMVSQLESQLLRRGWTRHAVSEARDGDVVFGSRGNDWKDGGGRAHLGIMKDGLLYNNSNRHGQKWMGEPVDVALGKYPTRWVLRPPARKSSA